MYSWTMMQYDKITNSYNTNFTKYSLVELLSFLIVNNNIYINSDHRLYLG